MNEQGISEKAAATLLKIARETVEAAIKKEPLPEYTIDDPELQGHQGAFVTLNNPTLGTNDLRGCIGQFIADQPLYLVVRDMAAAATRDSRFRRNPVTPAELPEIEIEISVLSPLRKISDPYKEIELGKHGIYINRRGCYLPQVATDHNMTREEFLGTCCAHKAGLPADAWKRTDTVIEVFTAQILHEKK